MGWSLVNAGCVTLNWPLAAVVLGLTAPRIVAEWRNGWHSGGTKTGSEADSGP